MTPYRVAVHRFADAAGLGQAAADHARTVLNEVLDQGRTARVMLAAAPSQLPILTALARGPDLDVARIEFFHMDEYVGLPAAAPQAFGTWLVEHFVDRLPSPTTFRRIEVPPGVDPVTAATAYAAVLGEAPFDLTLCGLGVNAHLAFNDPPADFADPVAVRPVALSQESRQQQVDEGLFGDLAGVPTTAITVTIPRLLATGTVVACVLGEAKRWAVSETLTRDLDPEVPGTALATHPDAHLYVDAAAYD